MKPGGIGRIIQILMTLQAGKSYAVRDLSKMFGTSRQTIFRDLKELEGIGVPCRYDPERGGYTIGAWRTVFASIAKDVVKDLRSKIPK